MFVIDREPAANEVVQSTFGSNRATAHPHHCHVVVDRQRAQARGTTSEKLVRRVRPPIDDAGRQRRHARGHFGCQRTGEWDGFEMCSQDALHESTVVNRRRIFPRKGGRRDQSIAVDGLEANLEPFRRHRVWKEEARIVIGDNNGGTVGELFQQLTGSMRARLDVRNRGFQSD